MQVPGVAQAGGPAGKALRRADGWPIDPYGVVERAWDGDTVVCLGGGPSLTRDQAAQTQGRIDERGRTLRVIAINNAYAIAPWADILYFADADWWEQHRVREAFQKFAGQKVTIMPSGARVTEPDVLVLRNLSDVTASPVLSEESNMLATGSNGGYQAVNLAVLAGAKRILLLGYDMKADARGRTNWHREHRRITPFQHYEVFRREFDKLPPYLARLGVEVTNCTPDSALRVFPRSTIEHALAGFLHGEGPAALPA